MPTAKDLYWAIDCRSPGGVAALLAAGAPAIDTSQPAAVSNRPSDVSWSCPIRRTLHVLMTKTYDGVSGGVFLVSCPWFSVPMGL